MHKCLYPQYIRIPSGSEDEVTVVVSEEGDLRNVKRRNPLFLRSLCIRSILTMGTNNNKKVNHERTYRRSLDRTEEIGYGRHTSQEGWESQD